MLNYSVAELRIYSPCLMAWEENSHICLHMQLIAILSRIGANRATCVLHKYAADALTIHNENIHPLGVEKT